MSSWMFTLGYALNQFYKDGLVDQKRTSPSLYGKTFYSMIILPVL